MAMSSAAPATAAAAGIQGDHRGNNLVDQVMRGRRGAVVGKSRAQNGAAPGRVRNGFLHATTSTKSSISEIRVAPLHRAVVAVEKLPTQILACFGLVVPRTQR